MTASLAAASLMAASCAPNADEPGGEAYFGTTVRRGHDTATFYTNNGTEPEYLDPGRSNDLASAALILQLFEGLTTYHPKDLHPIQGVAVRWDTSKDGIHYRFHLRHDAKWSDGAPVTARDFEYAWRRVLRPKTASRAAPRLHVLKNGELFNLGRLKVAAADVAVCPEPKPCGDGAPILPKGSAARLVEAAGPSAPDSAPAGPRYVKIERFTALPFMSSTPSASSAPSSPPAPPSVAPLSGYVDASTLIEDDSLVGVRALDDFTLDVELERATPYFLNLTSSANLAPVRRDVIERFKDQEDFWVRPENIVVNGPYTLESWRIRYDITMKRNPYYREFDKIRLHRVVWLEVEDYRSTMNLYKTGEIDFIGPNLALPSEYMDLLATKKDFRRFPYLATYWYELNTKVPPLDDVRVRRALNMAVNKRELIEKVTRSGQIPATHYVPDFTGSGYSDQVEIDKAAGKDPFSVPDLAFDPARGRALLEEAGYRIVKEGDAYRAEGFPPVEILYNTSEGHRNIAVAIQGMWRANLGVAVTLRNEEWKVMLKNVRDGRFQVVRSGNSASYDHPHAWLDTFLSYSPENRSGWADPEFDALIKRAAASPDRAEGIRLYRQAEERAVAGMSRLPLYFYTKTTLVKPWVKGYYGNAQNVFLAKWAWIDSAPLGASPDEPAYAPEELPPPGTIEAP